MHTTEAGLLIFWPSQEWEELVCNLRGGCGEYNDSIIYVDKFDLRIKEKEFTGPEILKTPGHFLSVFSCWVCHRSLSVSESNCPTCQLYYTKKLCPGGRRAHATGNPSEYRLFMMTIGWLPQSIFCPLFSPKGGELMCPSGIGKIGWTPFYPYADTLFVSHCPFFPTKTTPCCPSGGHSHLYMCHVSLGPFFMLLK